MEKLWSLAWLSSKQPRKQRKYRYNAPLHKRGKMISSMLSKELRDKYKKRNLSLISGDKVKILRGQYKGTIGKVEKVLLTPYKVYVDGVGRKKIDGKLAKYPIDPSNVMIIDLNVSDKKRKEILTRK